MIDEEEEEVQGEESNVPVLGSGPEPRKVWPVMSTEQYPNLPHVVHSFFNVSRCQGCPEKINSTMPPPHDIFFQMKAIHHYQNKESLMWIDKVAQCLLSS